MKDNRQRLFEVMHKVNPDFVIKEANFVSGAANKITQLANSASNKAQDKSNAISKNMITKQLGDDFRLETYGDLKRIVNAIQSVKNKTTTAKTIGGAVLDQISGLGMAKSLLDVVKTMGDLPDDKKTSTWLDYLNIDDELSAIVDDSIEANFLNDLAVELNNEPDDKKLELNFDINAKLTDYIAKNYDNRTVTGAPKSLVSLRKFK